jgi:hypothetical protein
VVHHMHELKVSQLDNTSGAEFLKIQFYFIAGSLVLFFGALCAIFFNKAFKDYFLIGVGIVATLSIFTILKAKGYYSLGLYPAVFAFGSVWIEKLLSRKARLVVIPLLFLINILVFFSLFKIIQPALSPSEIRQKKEIFEKMGFMRWEDGKNHELPQDFADMQGWKEMSDKALQAYKLVTPEERKFTIVHCDNYGQTGALNYYNRGKMPEAYSFCTDYIFWIPEIEKIQNVILIGEMPEKEVIKLFDACILVGTVENNNAREKGTQIYLLKGAKEDLKKMYYMLKNSKISNFDIF